MRQRITLQIVVEMDGSEWLTEPEPVHQDQIRRRGELRTFVHAELPKFRPSTEVLDVHVAYAERGPETLSCGCYVEGTSYHVSCDEGQKLHAAVNAADEPYYAALRGDGPFVTDPELEELRLSTGLAYGHLEAHFQS